MTAPALPEIFGNYTLGDFVEVVSPASISWWPQTTGWILVAAGLLMLAGRFAWRRLLHWYRNRYRAEALKLLQQVPAGADTVTEANRLLKLTALAAFSREQVASLCGDDWVNFLNRQCPAPVFDRPQQQLLAEAIYTGAPVDQASGAALLKASVAWVQQHKNAYDA